MSEELNEIEEVEETVKSYDFPEGTVFFQEIREEDGYKWLAGVVTRPETADKYGILENHVSVFDLVIKKGRFYLKGYEPAEETREEMIARRQEEIVNIVQNIIDETAHQKNYDDGVSCASYVGDPDEEFNGDAVAFKAWRGRCWRTCYNILNSVEAGTVAPEDVTDEYVLERLPIMEWPEV